LLLQSAGFSSPKDAGLAIAQLQQVDVKAMTDLGSQIGLVEGVKLADVAAALEALRAEIAEKTKAK
jgi:tryptophanyl-tRNA synthetase